MMGAKTHWVAVMDSAVVFVRVKSKRVWKGLQYVYYSPHWTSTKQPYIPAGRLSLMKSRIPLLVKSRCSLRTATGVSNFPFFLLPGGILLENLISVWSESADGRAACFFLRWRNSSPSQQADVAFAGRWSRVGVETHHAERVLARRRWCTASSGDLGCKRSAIAKTRMETLVDTGDDDRITPDGSTNPVTREEMGILTGRLDAIRSSWDVFVLCLRNRSRKEEDYLPKRRGQHPLNSAPHFPLHLLQRPASEFLKTAVIYVWVV